jgi:hypothetical protein
VRRTTAVIIFFVIVVSLSAQHYRAGAGLTAGFPNDYAKAYGGFDLFIEYIHESPLFFRTSGGFAVTKFSDYDPYIHDVKYSLYWIEGSLMYLLLKSDAELYIGGGIGYYIINAEDFNEVQTFTGHYIPKEFSNKVSYHIKAGLSYPIHRCVKLHFQAKYLFLKENLVVEEEEIVNDKVIRNSWETEIDFSTLFVTLGIILKI